MDALNFMRSTNAPIMSAGVITANVIWYSAQSASGSVSWRVSLVMPARNALSSPPTRELGASEKQSEYPKANHMMLVTSAHTRHCANTLSWFLRFTSPP